MHRDDILRVDPREFRYRASRLGFRSWPYEMETADHGMHLLDSGYRLSTSDRVNDAAVAAGIVARLKADAGEIIWTGIRIYETKTVQRLLTRKSDS